MRRALIGTLAGWLSVAACVMAQPPFPGSRMTGDRPASEETIVPVPVPTRQAAAARSPYGGYGEATAHFDEPAAERPIAGPATGSAGLIPNADCGCDGCGRNYRFWIGAEYLLWWTSGMHVPPLITTSPQGTPLGAAGVLGQPTTTVLVGGTINNEVRSGVRTREGVWLDRNDRFGLEGSFVYMGVDGERFTATPANVNDIIARPFFNVALGLPNSNVANFPALDFGSARVTTHGELFLADANLRAKLFCGNDWRIDVLAGYRFANLNERLVISENLVSVGVAQAGTGFLITDRFATQNQFEGGQLGLAGEWQRGRLFVDWRGLVALGAGIKSVTISGTTTTTAPGAAPVTTNVGLLAQPSNSGTFHSTDFSVLPEVGVNVGYQVSDAIRLWVGYSFLYWTRVVRPGNQIDLRVDLTQVQPLPAFHMNRTDIWMQGINFGAGLRF